jgi:hypothetical protein
MYSILISTLKLLSSVKADCSGKHTAFVHKDKVEARELEKKQLNKFG